jgi:hypothetical protein
MSDDKKEVETTEDWELYVRNEITSALDNFLPFAKDGNLGFVYKKAVIENTEAGLVYDEGRVSGVEIIIDLNFSEVIDKPV